MKSQTKQGNKAQVKAAIVTVVRAVIGTRIAGYVQKVANLFGVRW